MAAGRRRPFRPAPTRWRRTRQVLHGVLLGVVAIIGMLIGVQLGGHTTQDIGPFQAQLSLTPSLHGDTSVEIPPLGSLELDSHDGPAHLQIRLESLDEARTRAVVADSGNLEQVSHDAVDQLNLGVRRLALQTAGSGLLGAMILVGLTFRARRDTAIAGLVVVAVLASVGGATALSFKPAAIQEPTYRGLLVNAPAIIGDARRISDRYEEYRAQLQKIVLNVSKLYGTISALPVYEPNTSATKVLHISDMHLNPAAWGVVRTVADQFSVDVVVDTGDINDWGSEPESSYVGEISKLRVPYLYVRGNHDSAVTAAAVAKQPNATVLDNSIVTVEGLTFAGIGDPRFTPDKSTDATDAEQHAAVVASGERLAEKILASPMPVDVALVHDPVAAQPLAGICPLVLAGHRHARSISRLDPDTPVVLPSDGASPPAQQERTLLMVEGSTGGAGLRGLESAKPLPLALSILYFDEDRHLSAYDDIQVGGTGLTEVSLQRHIVAADKAAPAPSVSAVPTPSSVSPSVTTSGR
ncbi:metallophosphoesterase family protein [Dactylosporangium aurantiacum]|uniref:Metallophosphoesterase family protein n=2 Tax=Dactylosporangium aurantiacum TaxID=35754 RepID=A0A9Q9MJT4_9ACTN|nr:metallophosphoesterase family protein [Dactylosporangium aurantiacum]